MFDERGCLQKGQPFFVGTPGNYFLILEIEVGERSQAICEALIS